MLSSGHHKTTCDRSSPGCDACRARSEHKERNPKIADGCWTWLLIMLANSAEPTQPRLTIESNIKHGCIFQTWKPIDLVQLLTLRFFSSCAPTFGEYVVDVLCMSMNCRFVADCSLIFGHTLFHRLFRACLVFNCVSVFFAQEPLAAPEGMRGWEPVARPKKIVPLWVHQFIGALLCVCQLCVQLQFGALCSCSNFEQHWCPLS